jgi:predicted TIM-barrel fold metal-dependent hydrolase
MTQPPFVDSHIHLWDLEHPDLTWSWLAPDAIHPQLGEIRELKTNYEIDDYLADIEGSNVTKAVHVQAAIGSADPVQETEWLQGLADRTGFPHAIVAYANLKDPAVEAELERHCAFANTRGIRDFSEGDYLVDSDFHRGFALLEKFDLVCDLDCLWPDMAKARDLARRFPGITIVLDHAGFP